MVAKRSGAEEHRSDVVWLDASQDPGHRRDDPTVRFRASPRHGYVMKLSGPSIRIIRLGESDRLLIGWSSRNSRLLLKRTSADDHRGARVSASKPRRGLSSGATVAIGPVIRAFPHFPRNLHGLFAASYDEREKVLRVHLDRPVPETKIERTKRRAT